MAKISLGNYARKHKVKLINRSNFTTLKYQIAYIFDIFEAQLRKEIFAASVSSSHAQLFKTYIILER